MTALEAIKRAMTILAILQTGESPSNQEADDALLGLNQMLHNWDMNGIPLSHSDIELNDTLAFPDNHLQPIVYNLAVLISTGNGVQPNAIIIAYADNGYSNLQNFYAQPPELSFDQALHPYYKTNRFY